MAEEGRRARIERARKLLVEAGWLMDGRGKTYWITKTGIQTHDGYDCLRGVYVSKDSLAEADDPVKHVEDFWNAYYEKYEKGEL